MIKSYQKLRNKMPARTQATANKKMLQMLTEIPLQELQQAKYLSQEKLTESLDKQMYHVWKE